MSPLDERLLEAAKRAKTTYEAAEATVRAAKADYHSRIRALDQLGGSSREIAEAVGLSHQRVNQIVNGQGAPVSCSFCSGSQHDRKKLIAGPSVYICDECLRSLAPPTEGSGLCSFCGKTAEQVTGLHASEDAAICDECVALCFDIMAEEPS
jgi:hypothetical protein